MTHYKGHHMHHDFTPKAINSIAYDDASKRMAVARFDESGCYIEVWCVDGGYWVYEKSLPTISSVEGMLWHSGLLVVGGLEGNLVLFDVNRGCIKESVSSNFGPIWCLALNAKKKLIAAGTEEGCVVLFEVLQDSVVYKQAVAKQPGRILSICWYQADIIVTGSSDVRVFDTTSGRCVQRIAVGKQLCVWALAITRNFTIITGDSSGHTSFWYGEPGQVTHSKRYRSHEADIHSVCLNQPHNLVTLAGVDGIVVFKLASGHKSSAAGATGGEWLMAGKRTYHSNDVRCLQFIADRVLVSAGLDCQLVVSERKKKMFKIPAYHQRSLVKLARLSRCLLHQYDKSLELWMADRAFCDEEDTSKFKNDIPPNHTKLAVFNSKTTIHSSFVSEDAKYVAFSDENSTCVFRTVISSKSASTLPSIRIHRMQLPTPLRTTPSSHLASAPRNPVFVSVSEGNILTIFGPDDGDGEGKNGVGGDGDTNKSGDGREKGVVVEGKAGKDGRKVINLKMKVLCTVTLQDDISLKDVCFNSTCTHLYVASIKHSILLIHLATASVVGSLPSHHKAPTSICPHPSNPQLLLVSYADGLIAEYNTKKGMHSKRSKIWKRNYHPVFPKLQHRFINKILYDSSRPDWLLLQHDAGFSLVDWSQLQKTKDKKVKTSQLLKYVGTNALFCVDTTATKQNLFMVEKSSLEMMATYQPPYKKHKFGQ